MSPTADFARVQARRRPRRRHPDNRRGAGLRVARVDPDLHPGVVPAHPPDRRVICPPGELHSPVRIRQRNHPPSKGRNFQKYPRRCETIGSWPYSLRRSLQIAAQHATLPQPTPVAAPPRGGGGDAGVSPCCEGPQLGHEMGTANHGAKALARVETEEQQERRRVRRVVNAWPMIRSGAARRHKAVLVPARPSGTTIDHDCDPRYGLPVPTRQKHGQEG